MKDTDIKMSTILYVDDDEPNLQMFNFTFIKNFNVITAKSSVEALNILESSQVKIVIADQRMPGMTGIELLKIIKKKYPDIIRLILTAFSDINEITDGINQAGVLAYIYKPFNKEELLAILTNAVEVYDLRWNNKMLLEDLKKRNDDLSEEITEHKKTEEKLRLALDEVNQLKNKLYEEKIYLQEEIKTTHNFSQIISKSEKYQNVLTLVEQVARTDAPVLITGETGTGKELLARSVHDLSNRSDAALVKINCASIPEALFESELFGHEKGAFTGATSAKKGRFEIADGGTIFLDEVGEIPLAVQAKLLRVLQEGEFEHVGSTKTISVKVRIISATNRDLETMCKDGIFRYDLFYRLNVFPIHSYPLRERKEDIPLLVNYFIKKFSRQNGKNISSISKKALNSLLVYNWPGNIRELENIIERATIISNSEVLDNEISALKFLSSTSISNPVINLKEGERKQIVEVLQQCNWKIQGSGGAAAMLGIPPSTLRSKMKKLGIERD